MSVADNGTTVAAPKDWAKAVAAAYLRALGATQQEAAMGVSCGRRTLRRWEAQAWWPKAMKEACDRWLNDVIAASRGSVLKNIRAGDAAMALTILERTEPRLLPKSRSEITPFAYRRPPWFAFPSWTLFLERSGYLAG